MAEGVGEGGIGGEVFGERVLLLLGGAGGEGGDDGGDFLDWERAVSSGLRVLEGGW